MSLQELGLERVFRLVASLPSTVVLILTWIPSLQWPFVFPWKRSVISRSSQRPSQPLQLRVKVARHNHSPFSLLKPRHPNLKMLQCKERMRIWTKRPSCREPCSCQLNPRRQLQLQVKLQEGQEQPSRNLLKPQRTSSKSFSKIMNSSRTLLRISE